MGLLDAYQDSTDTALRVMAARPLEPEAPAKQSAWKMPYSSVGDYVRNQLTIPRALAAGAAEVAGNVMDTAGAFGQVAAASGGLAPGFDPDARKNRERTLEIADNLKMGGIDWRTDEAKQAYKFGADLRPDPLTAGTAENIVFGLTKGLTKAIGAAATLGPVAGAAAFGGSEGLTTAEDLANQGVDQATRTKVGAVTAGFNATGVLLPVAGKTLAQTAGLVITGGPLSFMAQQAATREILRNADYKTIAEQYDPLDPVGLTIATLLPAGFAAYAKRGGFKATTKPDAQPAADNATATQGTVIPATPEAIDAAMVQNLTVARDARESSVAENNISESLGRLSELSLQQAGEVGITGNMTEGRIPPADWKILEEAGLIENRVSEDGTEYRAANMEALFNERARRHAENMANKSSVSPEEKARNIERRASNYERVAQSKEDEGYPEEAIPLREKANQLRKQAEDVRSNNNPIPVVKDSLTTQPEQSNPVAMVQNLTVARDDHSSSINRIWLKPIDDSFIDDPFNVDPNSRAYTIGTVQAIDEAINLVGEKRFSELALPRSEKQATDTLYFDQAQRVEMVGRKIVDFYEKNPPPKFDEAPPTAPLPDVKDSWTTQTDAAKPATQDIAPDAYAARVEALTKDQPDLIARLDEAGQPVKLADELAAIKKQAQEGTDTEFGALDAPLLKTAIECALSLGAA